MKIQLKIGRLAVLATAAAAWLAAGATGPAAADRAHSPAQFMPGVVVVGYRTAPSPALQADIASRLGARPAAAGPPGLEVVRVPPGQSVTRAAAILRGLPDVAYAVPDYLAHESGGWIPDDRGRMRAATDWRLLQWNFLPEAGVDAPDAWSNLFIDGAPGGRGVTVAILDTGVAYRDWVDPCATRSAARPHRCIPEFFARSPDFAGTRFTAPCDLIRGGMAHLSRGRIVAATTCTNPDALDRQGHGTFVAGVVAETTNNHLGLTGLAYGARIMPVRVLDAEGNGDSLTIARGIRYAVTHGARVINLSLEFDLTVGASDIPEVIDAIHFAHSRGVTVVAAAGNDQAQQLAYPARDSVVISVGATTRDRCLADYSNTGQGLDLVAPGGGDDAQLSDPDCHPNRTLPDVYQMTFPDPSNPTRFGLPGGWYGTSMASPHVAAAAALVIASGVLGAHPSPDQILARLERTAHPLGGPVPNAEYGYGLLDAGAATAGISRIARSRPARPRRPATA